MKKAEHLPMFLKKREKCFRKKKREMETSDSRGTYSTAGACVVAATRAASFSGCVCDAGAGPGPGPGPGRCGGADDLAGRRDDALRHHRTTNKLSSQCSEVASLTDEIQFKWRV
jgi:hypothetical protein